MKTTIVQCACDRFLGLQKQVVPHHAAYAERHGYLYSVTLGRVQTKFHPMWDRVPLIRAALAYSDLVIYLDTDSLIVNPDVPLTEALREMDTPVGHVRHPEPWADLGFHYNCGVGFYRNNPRTHTFLKEVWELGPIEHRWKVQATMLAVGCRTNIFSIIDDKWNSTVNTNVSKSPMVESWHGYNRDLTPILTRLGEVNLDR